jgi:hypothetical protein
VQENDLLDTRFLSGRSFPFGLGKELAIEGFGTFPVQPDISRMV